MSFPARNFVIIQVLIFLLVPSLARAQYTVGRVEGTVLDGSGAVISGATVTLRSAATNMARTFTTGRDGLYAFFAVPPGEYELSAEAPKFARRAATVNVRTNQTLTQNLFLAVGPESTVLEVQAAAQDLNLANSQHSTTRTDQELASLPSLGRNMISTVHLAPGVAPTNNPRGGSTFGGGGSYVISLGVQSGLIAANGGRARATSVQLDYTDANDWEGGGFAPGMQSITPDMLQEFKVLTSNFSAEYGVKSNAQVMMVTKSGGNRFHGAAYDLLQNDALNARDYFDSTGRPSPLKQNIYGFTVGGPIIKERTFFFGGYEGRRTRGASFTTGVSLPTPQARARAIPIMRDLLDRFVPLPLTSTSDPDIGKLSTQIPSPVDNYQFLAKLDHRLTDAHSVSIRYLQGTASFVARFPSQNLLPGFDVDNHFELRNLSLAETWVVNRRTVNELRLAYARSSAVGLPQNGLLSPRFQIVGLFNFGALESAPTSRLFNVYQVNDLLSQVRGAHLLKIGGDVRLVQDNSLNAPNSRGVFTFASLDTFLAGRPSQWTQLFGDTSRAFRTKLFGFFVQDDWKLTPTLTLNLGLRWDIQGALSEAHGLTSILDVNKPGAIGAAGTGRLGSFRSGGDAVDSNRRNLGPRVGFAWNPRGSNFVWRGGYGIYWDSFAFTALAASRSAPPLNYNFTLTAAQIAGANTFTALLNGSAAILTTARNLVGGFGDRTNFGNVTTIDPRLLNPYVQQFNFGGEFRFLNNYVFSLGYVGSKGTHLTRLIPINALSGGRRLDPRFDQVNLHEDGGSSIYHSLQAELRKSLSRGLQFQASYTWSKSIDDASDFNPTIQANDNSFPQDAGNLPAERALSNYDLPHRLVVTGIWQIPFFHRFKGFSGAVLDGWSFESVNMWQSGLPATLLAGARGTVVDVNGDGNIIRPGLDNTRASCDPAGAHFKLGDPAHISGIAPPLLGANGTCGRNSVRMNRLTNFDWSFFKVFQLAENGPWGSGPWQIQLRGEMYNLFNTPFLTATGENWRSVSSRTFGQVNAAGITRRVQLGLKLTW